MDNFDIFPLLQILVIAGVTILIRFLPFLLWGDNKKTPKYIKYLGGVLPPAIMGMLVIYCLKGISFEAVSGFVPLIIGTVSVVLLHCWKKNSIISILGGTIIYMILINLM